MSDRTIEIVVVKQECEFLEDEHSLGSPETQQVEIKLEPDTDECSVKQEIDIGPTELYKPLSFPAPQKKIIMKTSQNQYVLMVEYMELNGDLSKPSNGPRGRSYVQKKWAELTRLLNAEGTGIARSEDKWRKVWSDFKNNTKKKYAKLHQYTNRKDGGPALNDYLTEVEMRLMKITGAVVSTGVPQTAEASFTEDFSPNQPVQSMEEESDDFTGVVEEENVGDTLESDDQGSPHQLQANPVAHKTRKTHTDLTQTVLAYQEKLLEYEKKRDEWMLQLEQQKLEIEAQRIEVEKMRVEVEKERIQVERDRVQQQAVWMNILNKVFNIMNEVLERKRQE